MTDTSDPCNVGPCEWSYPRAFARNLGLIHSEEQQRLRNCRVAIAGMGGVGGADLVALARLGIGKFTIADPDTFDVVNTNRQYGAAASTLGLSKANVMAALVRDINPTAEITVFTEPIGPENADAFLCGADALVDGIDAFEIGVRRLLFRLAAQKGIYAVSAGPFGFSTVWAVFDPHGMSFDRYFDLHDDMDQTDQFVAFIVGMAPKATHRSYIDLSKIDFRKKYGPSAGLACQLSAGVAAAEVLKILLQRGPLRPVPYYHQFDAYLGKCVGGRLPFGNRGPLQRLKRRVFTRFLRQAILRIENAPCEDTIKRAAGLRPTDNA